MKTAKTANLLIALIALLIVSSIAAAAFYLGVRSTTTPPPQTADAAAVSDAVIPDAPDVPDDSPVPELEAEAKGLGGDSLLYAIGMGESSDEMVARTMAADDARARLARAIEAQGQSGSGEEGITVSGAVIRKSITQYDNSRRMYRIYSLIVQNKEMSRADSAKIEEIMKSLGTKKAD